ncbi:hypothetical protein H721_02848 [Brucella ovis IntaBari-2006-46-332]|nr:hypothetical protein B999_02984 [Brucella ovis 63/96]ENS95908.1 hypothetical protein C009_02864 [Brucella ovis 81/8]ENT81142.1 hypothetical protein H713_03001 [Brucella ovis IntaBari-2010-47-268]ENT85311.1 hypothetical protein H721_02848 [Brucella ovis IntaBari-2006-46-332]ENT93176.1 hypothetical protein H716_02740 [Brucella ovis IntaBari-2001-319-5096]
MWCCDQFLRRAAFDNPPMFHHRNAVCHLRGDAKIMRDEEIGRVFGLLYFPQQLQNCTAHSDIKCRYCFVQHDE